MAGEKESVHLQKYPELINYIKSKKDIYIVLTVNGKKRGELIVTDLINKASIIHEAQKNMEKYGVDKHTQYTYIEGKIIKFATNHK